eukprot:2872836-Rhodomonas_salina.1
MSGTAITYGATTMPIANPAYAPITNLAYAATTIPRVISAQTEGGWDVIFDGYEEDGAQGCDPIQPLNEWLNRKVTNAVPARVLQAQSAVTVTTRLGRNAACILLPQDTLPADITVTQNKPRPSSAAAAGTRPAILLRTPYAMSGTDIPTLYMLLGAS